MKNRKKAILIALAIGDGHIAYTKRTNPHKKIYSILRLIHSSKQREYITYKRDLLHSLVGGKSPNLYEFNNSGYSGIRFNKRHKYFRVIRKWLYRDDKKHITRFLLDKLTPEAIAIWWMDDGSMYKKRNSKTGKIKACEGILSTYISEEDNQIIIDYFKEVHDIEFRVVKSKNSYRLRLNTANCRKFAKLVKPYIIPSMLYKIDVSTKNN